MTLSWNQQTHIFQLHPLLHNADCLVRWKAISSQPGVGGNSDKSRDGLPRQTNQFGRGNNVPQPNPRGTVLNCLGIIGVNQQICIWDNQRWYGPSSSSRRSEILSQFPIPSGKGVTTKGLETAFFSAFIRPRLSKRLIVPLKESPVPPCSC